MRDALPAAPPTFRSGRGVYHALAGFILLVSALAAPARTWRALYVFGDSYSDSGAGYLDTDGPTAVVYAARELGIALASQVDPARPTGSVNFAVSGGKTGEGEGRRIKAALLDRGMKTQVHDFLGHVRQGAIAFDPETTLFFLAGGLNDHDTPTEATVAHLKEEISLLHGAGARYFLIARLPTAIPGFRATAQRLNPALARLPGDAEAGWAGVRVALSQWGRFFDDVMADAAAHGFTNTTDGCAGRALFDEDPTPRGDPRTYYYFHAEHPSTAVHALVGKSLAAEMRESFP